MAANETVTGFQAKVLNEAKWVCDYVRDNEFVYGDAPINPAINCDAKKVSCDRMVGWVLYRLGYTDQPYVQGLCVSGPNLGNWCIDHNFEKVNSVAELQPGDIVFTKPLPPAGCPGHTFIFAGRSEEEGMYYRYDCGRLERIRSTQPSLEPIGNDFMYGYRPHEPQTFIPSLSFMYDGVPFDDLDKKVEITDNLITYTLPDGIIVTTEIKRYPKTGVVWWVNKWHNPTDHDSALISELWDCDITAPFAPDAPRNRRNRQSTWEHNTFRVIETKGANVQDDDYTNVDQRLWAGQSHESHNYAGRSGYGTLPFFDINRQDVGVLMATGWTGAWHAMFDRSEDACRIRSGLQHAKFRMRPGESLRTSSTAMMFYYRGQAEAHNRWRHFIADISPIGKNNRANHSPFSAIFWGGVPTDEMIKRWGELFKHNFPFDTCWIDAGWYEPLSMMGTDAQLAAWENIGTWEVSKAYHPDEYKSLIDYLHSHGVGFMVWFEPERVRPSVTKWVKTLPSSSPTDDRLVAALNDDEVCDQIIEKISSMVEKLQLSVYRQDFNIAPESSWLANDEEDRGGITEIKYITNLYRFWDTLLERFSNLLIDDCAGGGHRVDLEMLSRSVPLWRDDYQCTWDCCPEVNQLTNSCAAWWFPYSGIGYGPTLGDTYSFRSAYNSGITVRTWEHSGPEFGVGASNEPFDWAEKYFAEYKELQPYFGKDFYQLMPVSQENSSWCASQFHDTDTDKGIILAFRRAKSPFDRANFKLGGLHLYSSYRVTNRDTGESFTALGCDLVNNGHDFIIPEKRQAVIWQYERI